MNPLKFLIIITALIAPALETVQALEVPVLRPHVRADVFLDTHHNKFAPLNSCGGTVELKMVAGRADLVFRGVRSCSNFDIVESNGHPTRYPNRKLQGVNGDRSGSFTLPSYILDYGFNGVLVTLRSDSGKHQEVIYIQFFDRR